MGYVYRYTKCLIWYIYTSIQCGKYWKHLELYFKVMPHLKIIARNNLTCEYPTSIKT